MTDVKAPAEPHGHHARMVCTIIPIHAAPAAPAVPLAPTCLVGEPQQLQRLLDALEADVKSRLPAMAPVARWLRELRLGNGEAFALVAPDLGHDGLESAEIAFDTLRRLLPDTDIYVSAAPA